MPQSRPAGNCRRKLAEEVWEPVRSRGGAEASRVPCRSCRRGARACDDSTRHDRCRGFDQGGHRTRGASWRTWTGIKDEDEKASSDGKEVSRRDFLKMAGVAGATIGVGAGLGGLVAACGGDEETTTTTAGPHHDRWPVTTSSGGATTTVSAVETGPRAEDRFRHSAHRPARFVRRARPVLRRARQGSHRRRHRLR